MREKLRFLGMDVDAETIAVAEPDGEVRSLGTIRQPRRFDPQVHPQVWFAGAAACLLRSRPDRLRTLLGTDAVGRQVRCGGAAAGSEEAPGTRQGRPAGSVESGARSSLR